MLMRRSIGQSTRAATGSLCKPHSKPSNRDDDIINQPSSSKLCRGKHDEVIYMVGKPAPVMWARQCAFGKVLEQVQQGPLTYRAGDNLPFGEAWNTGVNYGDRKSCSMWTAELDGIGLATSLEIPYANAAGGIVDADTSRAFGRDLARAIRAHLTR